MTLLRALHKIKKKKKGRHILIFNCFDSSRSIYVKFCSVLV